jgi:membrane associated rhomboid family serine protease
MESMARRGFLDRSYGVLGGSLPAPVALVIGATLVSSILAAQLAGFGLAIALVPGYVLQGQVWRLVSWVFVEPDPLGLIFAGLALYWFGRDLVRVWGAARFLGAYVGLAAVAAAITCAAAFASPVLMGARFVGAWPIVSGLIIAWACVFPTRSMLLYFVIPLQGRNLIYATLAGTLLFALLGGSLAAYIPHFAAQLVTLAAMRGNPFGGLWARLKFEVAYGRWRRRASRLRAVPRPDEHDRPRYYH